MSRHSRWFERHPSITLAAANLLGWLMIELLSWAAAYFGYWSEYRLPDTSTTRFWEDVNETVGVWHRPNHRFRHQRSCFDLVYESNSYGARDIERSRGMSPGARRRFVVLGDSFVEGYGVTREQRFTERMERATGYEMLNFGTSGEFGPIQEWLLYRDLASRFAHTDVILMLLPDNDFSDMRPEYHDPRRYRPYLRWKGEHGYELYYPVSFAERWRGVSEFQAGVNSLLNHSYALRLALGVIRERLPSDIPRPKHTRPSYLDFDARDLQLLFHSLGRLVELAKDKRVYIAAIPRQWDLSLDQARLEPGIPTVLQDWAAGYGNVRFVDLLPAFHERMREEQVGLKAFFRTCDGHWNGRGHRVAAEALVGATTLPSGGAQADRLGLAASLP